MHLLSLRISSPNRMQLDSGCAQAMSSRHHNCFLMSRHSIDLSFHVATSAESVSSQIQQHLGYEAQRIRTAIPTAEMNILRSSASVLQACTRGDAGPCNVDLLCTPSSSPSLKGIKNTVC